MEHLMLIRDVASIITVTVAALAIFVKPIREWLFDTAKVKEGQKCLLRDAMMRTYYASLKSTEIRQYEYESFMYCYKAYKAMGGNSFIDKLKEEIEEFHLIP